MAVQLFNAPAATVMIVDTDRVEFRAERDRLHLTVDTTARQSRPGAVSLIG